MNTMLSNAVSSVQIGVEDYLSATADQRRALSAIRNVSAGILLLFKERLRAMSPPGSDDVLIKERLSPSFASGSLSFVGEGRKTVDVQQIKDRFRALAIGVDWKTMDSVLKIRNEIEHFQTDATPARLREALSDAFVVMRNFVSQELKLDPRVLLGESTWGTLLDVAKVYESERAATVEALLAVDWRSPAGREVARHIRCPECGSDLLRPASDDEIEFTELTFHCGACGHDCGFYDVIDEAISDCYYADNYLAATQGGEPPLAECPECERETYHYDETSDSMRCLACGYADCFRRCEVCSQALEPYEDRLCDHHQEMARDEAG